MKTHLSLSLLLACATLSCAYGCTSKKADAVDPPPKSSSSNLRTIHVTGIPDENPTKLAREYQPLVDMLQKALGSKVEYIPVTDYGAAVQALAAGKVDFAWLGGFTHVQARTMADVTPLVMREIDRKFRSAFIASTASGITTVAEMKGKTFAFGSKSSTSGHLMPRHFLLEKFGIDPKKDFDGPPIFSGAHDATAKMVESGKVAAGALNIQVWKRMVREKSVDTSKVTLIGETPPYVDYVWTVRRSVDPGIREAFAEAFLKLNLSNKDDKLILDRMGAKKYVRASAKDFDAIEKIARETGLLK